MSAASSRVRNFSFSFCLSSGLSIGKQITMCFKQQPTFKNEPKGSDD